MTLRLGIVGTLPAVDTGPADHLSYLVPALAPRCTLSCFVPDVALVREDLRQRFDVHSIDELGPGAADVLIYQIANNPEQEGVNQAARTGPPGLLEIHDGSQHHNLAHLTQQRGFLREYRDAMEAAHGEAGARLADLRGEGPGFQLEHVVFDALAPMLRRHRGAIVHNHWAQDLVARRCPGAPTWLAPNPAPPARARSRVDRAALGLSATAYVIGNFGFVTHPKRPLLLFEAFVELCHRGVDAVLVYGGSVREGFDLTIRRRAAEEDLQDRVVITGYLDRSQLNSYLDAADVVFNCRFPQLGESSGILAEAMAAGKPTLVHPIGAWADLPEDVVVRVQMGTAGEELAGVVAGLERLLDPTLRAAMGAAARAYAGEHLSIEKAAQAIITAAQATVDQGLLPMNVRLAAAAERAATALQSVDDLAARALLTELPPALTPARLLLLGSAGWADAIAEGFGYTVTVAEPDVAGPLPHPAATFHAVLTTSAVVLAHPDPWSLLGQVNRVLDETGTCLMGLENGEAADLHRLLVVAGFDPSDRGRGVIVAAKAGLPEARRPADLYAEPWLERVAKG